MHPKLMVYCFRFTLVIRFARRQRLCKARDEGLGWFCCPAPLLRSYAA